MPNLSKYTVVVRSAENGREFTVNVDANYSTIQEDGVLRFWRTTDADLVAAFRDWVYVVRGV